MMKTFLAQMSARPFARQFLIFLAFIGLTVIMTWPWAIHLRDAVADTGDPYISAWSIWWDYHQTFHDPLHLFQANTGYPYQDTLAFGENAYGVALLFFPFFALGLQPLTVLGIATLTGFAFSGYGAFRLAKTLTGSTSVAWIAGIVFGFVPYHFLKLPHLHYLFSAWIPLLLEALVLFARERSWKRAVWLGVTFLMNGLTCLTWFLLTPIPFALAAVILLTRYRIWTEKKFWQRGAVALGASLLMLLPFLMPYQKVSKLYGFSRSYAESEGYSATFSSWLVVDARNKLWRGLGDHIPQNSETALFPGLLPPLFALAAFLLVEGEARRQPTATNALTRRGPPRRLLMLLDALTLSSLVVALLTIGYGVFQPHLFGITLFKAKNPSVALMSFTTLLIIRCLLAYPLAFRGAGKMNLLETLRSEGRSEAFFIGTMLTVIGFFGSLGTNFFFHRFLFDNFSMFHSMRVPARWAMYCYLGLALLAGLGATRVAATISNRHPSFRKAMVMTVIVLALLFEQRVAPLSFARGEVDPDELTLWLKTAPMRGGLVELPSNQEGGYFRYTLRAADHGRPLINGANSFLSPTEQEIERLTAMTPIPDQFLDLLESVPASYVVLHYGTLTPEDRAKFEDLLTRGVNAGRLKFIRTYQTAREREDIYAVIKTEPAAQP